MLKQFVDLKGVVCCAISCWTVCPSALYWAFFIADILTCQSGVSAQVFIVAQEEIMFCSKRA